MSKLFGAFKRPVGAAADVRELEYISALHQTSKVLHSDGTISARDVLLFLRSRYGLVITIEDAMDIVKGLSGTARLPLPHIEKKRWGLVHGTSTIPEDVALGGGTIPEDVELGEPAPRKRCSCRLRRKVQGYDDIKEEEDELAPVEAQCKKMAESKTDSRKGWEFPSMQRQIRREIPRHVENLVRFDLVQMMGMLFIPSLLRAKRYRFSEPTPPPPPRPPHFDHNAKWHRLLWKLARLSGSIIMLPIVYVQQLRQRRFTAIKDSLRPKPATLVLDVLSILLGSLEAREAPLLTTHDLADSATVGTSTIQGKYLPELRKTIVTKDLIRQMLVHFQQTETAEDDLLIEQMAELVGGEGAILNERAFAHALTSDVESWPLECEDDVTTTFYDVYGFANVECNKYAKILKPEDLLAAPNTDQSWSPITQVVSQETDVSESFHSAKTELSAVREGGSPLRLGKIPIYKPTASYIDYASDSFRSVAFVGFLFGFYLAGSVYIVALLNYSGITKLNCGKSFGCVLVGTIWNWMTLAIVLSVSGCCIIVPISLVNNHYLQSFRQVIFSLCLLVVYISGPFIEKFLVDYVGINVSDQYQAARSSAFNKIIFYFFLLFGCLTLIESLRGIGSILLPKTLVRRFAILRFIFVPADIRCTAAVKKAGTHKLNDFIDRAYRLQTKAHKKAESRNADHETMLNFLLNGLKEEDCGGLFWTWSNTFFHRGLCKADYVWIHSGLVTGQMGQIIVASLLGILWWLGTQSIAAKAEESRNQVEGSIGASYALWFIPEPWMIYLSFYPGGGIALFLVFLLILIPYPNTASIVLKFRSGFLPSLHNPLFQRYRADAALTYYNVGNMIYALVGAAGFLFILMTGMLFLLYWPPTRGFMTLVLAWGIGLGITVGLKMVLNLCCGSNYWKGLYRNRPGAANFSSLAFECWHIGLGGGVMIGRLTQFLLAAAFWIGRIDSPLLSDDVEFMGYRFDTVCEKYLSEIVIHDAHRHPFIERISAMYLMRLKHGEHFGSDAGATWRSLFVLTLMPWLLKYSQGRDYDGDDEDDTIPDDMFPLNEGLPNEDTEGTAVSLSGNVPWERSNSACSSDEYATSSGIGETTVSLSEQLTLKRSTIAGTNGEW